MKRSNKVADVSRKKWVPAFSDALSTEGINAMHISTLFMQTRPCAQLGGYNGNCLILSVGKYHEIQHLMDSHTKNPSRIRIIARGYHSSCADLFYWGSRTTYVRLGKNKKPALVTLLHFFFPVGDFFLPEIIIITN